MSSPAGHRSAALLPPIAVSAVVLAVSVLVTNPGVAVWNIPPDYAFTWAQSMAILHGHPLSVYQANSYAGALPGFPALLAATMWAEGHLGIVRIDRLVSVAHLYWPAIQWPACVVGALSVFGVDSLLAALRLPPGRRAGFLACYGLGVACPALIWAGHPEDLAALGLVCWALAAARRGEWGRGALILIAASMMQDWSAILFAPYLAAASGPARLRVFVCGAVTAAVGAIFLVAGGAAARMAMLGQPAPDYGTFTMWHYLDPLQVVAAPGVGARTMVLAGSSRGLTVLLCIAISFALYRRRLGWGALVFAIGIVLASRGLTEPSAWPYYVAPGLTVLASLGVGRLKRPQSTCLALCCLGLAVLATPSYWSVRWVLPWWLWTAVYAGGLGFMVAALRRSYVSTRIVPGRLRLSTRAQPRMLLGRKLF